MGTMSEIWSMSFVRYKKRGNKWYVYEVSAFWDKKSKKSKQHTKYLGTSDTQGGEYSKPGKLAAIISEKAIVDFGDSYMINEIAKNCDFTTIIENSFGNLDTIMTLICYQMTQGAAMMHCRDWADGNSASLLFPNSKINSQDISRLFQKLGQEGLQRKFFKDYIGRFFKEQHGILIDSTALPSAINTPINAWGYGAEGIDQNVSCLVLVDKISKLPIYFRAVPGDIPDVSTLETTINEITRLGLKMDSAVLDAGYFSESNVRYLCEKNVNFITRLPRSRKIFKALIEDAGSIESRAYAIQYGERAVFIKSIETTIYDQKLHVHIILDPYKKAKDTQLLLRDAFAEGTDAKEIDEKMHYCGYFILISRALIEREEILPTYYTRQSIEQIFGFAKCNNNLLPLRVHNEQSVKGYIMLVFLSIIVFVMMRQRLQPTFTVENALLILRGLKAKVHDKELAIQEPNKKTKDISKLLNILVPTSLGI